MRPGRLPETDPREQQARAKLREGLVIPQLQGRTDVPVKEPEPAGWRQVPQEGWKSG